MLINKCITATYRLIELFSIIPLLGDEWKRVTRFSKIESCNLTQSESWISAVSEISNRA